MIVYFVPGSGIFGGIKVAYQFVDALRAAGRPAVIASPGGEAATWFHSNAPVVDRTEVLTDWQETDTAIFSLPGDYAALRPHVDQLVYHCQGTDPDIDAFLGDSSVTVLTCWDQARDYVQHRGVAPHDTGIAVSEVFFYAGEPKIPGRISCMPRRGQDFLSAFVSRLPRVDLVGLDGMSEQDVAQQMKQSQFFLASSAREWFGLPALEAMAAGCVVLTPEVLGGMEYLHNGRNCVVGEPEILAEFFIQNRGNGPVVEQMSFEARATAAKYSIDAFTGRTIDLVKSGVL